MAIRANVSSTGSQPMHADAICGELAPNVTAAGSTQATATLLRRLSRHVITGGTGGVIVTPGIGLGQNLDYGDEIQISNSSGVSINVYPPLGAAFYGSSTNAAVALANGYSVSVLMQNVTTYLARFYFSIGASSATVSSVALTAPAEISVAGSPITTTGTLALTWASQTQYKVFASPAGSTGTPAFRALVNADLPASGVTAASYTYASLTVNAQGIVTAASNGAAPTGGTVTSVALALPSIITVSGSPVTTTGTLTGTLATQTANTVFAGPTSGGVAQPTFRAMVAADLVNNGANPTGTVGASAVNGTATTWMRSDGAPALGTNFRTADISFIIDGAGLAITTGVKGDLQINFNCTIQANTVLLDQSGSIVIDIWKDTYANYPPTGGDSIAASAKPTVSSATKSTDSTLTGWTTSIAAGDTLRFNVDSITTATRALLNLKVIKT